MIKNVFLTGKLHIGKSTVIDAVVRGLALTPGGFRTVRSEKVDGSFGVHIVDAGAPAALAAGNRVALCDGLKFAMGFVAFPKVFDTVGVQLLADAKKSPLIVMDELGFMETDAILFHEAVRGCLDSDTPILGVIKQACTNFLNEIRERNDVQIIDIGLCNRKYAEDLVKKLIKNSPA